MRRKAKLLDLSQLLAEQYAAEIAEVDKQFPPGQSPPGQHNLADDEPPEDELPESVLTVDKE